MNTQSKKKLVAFSAAMFVVILLSFGSPAYAQRDAGAKARGEFGTGFWNPKYPSRSSSRRYTYRRPATESRRSFSYAPAQFSPGDNVVVAADETEIKKGTETLGIVMKGQKFKVRKIEGPWLGVEIEIDGRMINGWIQNRHVALAESAAEPAKKDDKSGDTAQPRTERRSYSYEPSQRRLSQQSYRGSGNRTRSPIERRLRPGRGFWNR